MMPLSTHVRLLDAQEPDHEGPIDKLAFELVLATRLKPGDLVLCTAGDVVPADGVVVEGMATIDDGGQTPSPIVTARRLLVRRGTHLASGYIILRVAA
jgi:K+-transporting ATPase ATPase B chain